MQFVAGSFSHDANFVNVRHNIRPNRNARGFTWSVTETLELSGVLIPSTVSQANIASAITSLEAAYKFGTSIGDAGLNLDSGAASPHYLSASNAIGGVRVEYLDFPPDNNTGEFATGRQFSIVLSAIYSASNVAYQQFEETITVQGTGGAQKAVITTLQGPPKEQILAQRTPVFATQTGRAVGVKTYPPYPSPLWPRNEELDKRQQAKGSPRNEGGTFVDWPISWSYQFISAGPLGGTPHRV